MSVYEPVSGTAFRLRGEFIDVKALEQEVEATRSNRSWGRTHDLYVSLNSVRDGARFLMNDKVGNPDGYSAHEVWSPEKRRRAIRTIAYCLDKLRSCGLSVPPAALNQRDGGARSYLVYDDEFSEEGW